MTPVNAVRANSVEVRFRGVSSVFVACVCCIYGATVGATDRGGPGNEAESPWLVRIDPERTTQFDCSVNITGSLRTPSRDGEQTWELSSESTFQFAERQLQSTGSGPRALQAVRRYSTASAVTNVGQEHQTRISIPATRGLIHVAGSGRKIRYAAARHPLSRRQLDLLQMPCDPLPCSGLLPTRDVSVGEKWNTDVWVLPLIAGLDAVTEQSMTCESLSMDEYSMRVRFSGSVTGAALGSASTVELEGTLTFDRKSQLIQKLNCHLMEKRTPGPVSPGIDATVDVLWTQTADSSSVRLPVESDTDAFEEPLVLTTPWDLLLRHSREWHVFNQTQRVLMLRQIRSGVLISQCNISLGMTMPPGQYTPDADFRADVERAVRTRDGYVLREQTIRDAPSWRVRHVQAGGTAGELEITWDYFLCSSAGGQQFSLVFSYSADDADEFGDEATRLLDSLSLARQRAALPFRSSAKND